MSSKFRHALAGRRLYPITDRHLSGLSHTEQILRFSEAGASLVQLREKIDYSGKFYSEAEAACRMARARGIKTIVNDRVDIALALKADGVHLGQDDLPSQAARRILGPEAIIGFSTHTTTQALLAAQMQIDYVAIGPIFATTTKNSTDRPLGLEGVRLVRQALPEVALVAIGGITTQNVRSVLSAGADAVSIISDFWSPPAQAELKLRELLSLS
jgi:thiamine-phosphate pyrophosphorylase